MLTPSKSHSSHLPTLAHTPALGALCSTYVIMLLVPDGTPMAELLLPRGLLLNWLSQWELRWYEARYASQVGVVGMARLLSAHLHGVAEVWTEVWVSRNALISS